jgi:hypothetical protein
LSIQVENSVQKIQKKEQRHRQTLELEWRRSKVMELNSQGYSESETAKILQVSLGTVYRDLSIIRQQARKNLQMQIEKTLPDEYHRCLTGLNQVLKTCWYIVHKPDTDDRTKLQATTIINDSYKYIMELVTNGSVITDAMKRITQLQNNADIIKKCDESLGSLEASEEVTTNGVF